MNSCQSRIYGAEFSKEEIEEAVSSGRLLSMEIEFNRSCNFHCIYCYAAKNSRHENELSREESRDVISQARDLGAKKIIILGGEPMLYPDIMGMIGFIRDLEMEIELFTNGANITAEIAQTLYDNRVRVVLKMNTFEEQRQDMLSGKKGAYTQIHEALKNLKLSGYPSDDCPMGVSTVICQQNIDELPRMWEWLRDQNIVPYFEMITPQGGAKEHNMLDVDSHRVEKFFHLISEIDRTKYHNHWEPQPPLVGGKCLRHQFSCAVNSQGYVQPCVGITIPIGNIREKKLGDILRDSEVIQDLKNYKQTLKGPCGECGRLSDCYGCRGAAYQMTGDYLASDPLCWKNLDRRDDILFLPVDASLLVPHKPPMLLIDRLIEIKERASLSEMTVRKDMVFVEENGKLDDASYPEIISQAIAAQEGFRKLGSRNPHQGGFLLGIKNIEILGSARIGDVLRISVLKVAKLGDFGIIKGEVRNGHTLIARGEVKVWQSNGKKPA
ncbi:MAG: radical SAM protein [Nitrospirae bacterium]|nr:MAG: radical SAM protein [Nitrospirota bacterium]